ncbi:MAG: hypothetical protein COC23_05205 [Hyphomicrobiales bacterium]|nr:MAG: hypothetical protein COC23_05205 [Hyphomicrobiales bacterium]
MFDKTGVRIAITRAAIVLVPSYLAAYLTDKMVYVVPTLAAASFFAASLTLPIEQTSRRVDEDGDTTDIEYGE